MRAAVAMHAECKQKTHTYIKNNNSPEGILPFGAVFFDDWTGDVQVLEKGHLQISRTENFVLKSQKFSVSGVFARKMRCGAPAVPYRAQIA